MATAKPAPVVTESTTEITNVAQPMSATEAIEAARKAQRTSISGTAAVETDDRGFVRLFNKAALVGKPFTIIDWEENLEDFGWAAIVHLVTRGGKALFIVDGSTGIYEQLKDIRNKTGNTVMLECPKGLRVSDYDNPVGEGRSRTYYLDDSAPV